MRVRPGARRTTVGGSRDGALLVTVAAPAVDGRANVAVLAALAGALGVRPRQLAIVTGDRGRDKVVELTGAPPGAAELLRRLLAGG